MHAYVSLGRQLYPAQPEASGTMDLPPQCKFQKGRSWGFVGLT